MVLWILISILVILILLGIIMIYAVKKGKRRPTDYYAFFKMGIIWLIFGIFMWIYEPEFTLGPFFTIIGFTYSILGILNKKSWKKNKITWEKLTKKEQIFRFWILIILGVFFFLGILIYFILSK